MDWPGRLELDQKQALGEAVDTVAEVERADAHSCSSVAVVDSPVETAE